MKKHIRMGTCGKFKKTVMETYQSTAFKKSEDPVKIMPVCTCQYSHTNFFTNIFRGFLIIHLLFNQLVKNLAGLTIIVRYFIR